MESFVIKTILPKLMYCMQMELHINPHQQDIGNFLLLPLSLLQLSIQLRCVLYQRLVSFISEVSVLYF